MSYANGPRIVTDGLVLCVDPNNPKCWDGSSSTITDMARGLSLIKGANTVATTFNGQRVFGSSSSSGTLDTGYRYSNAVVSSASSWTISGWIYKSSNTVSNWWHVYTDAASGDILTINNADLAFRTSMNNPASGGTFTTGSDVTDYGVNWNQLDNGWINIVLIYSSSGQYLQLYLNDSAQPQQTGRVINTNYQLRNFYGWGSANGSYYFNQNHSHTTVYNKALSAYEITQNYNVLKGRFGL